MYQCSNLKANLNTFQLSISETDLVAIDFPLLVEYLKLPNSKWLFKAITEGNGSFWKGNLGNGTKTRLGNQPRIAESSKARSSKNQLSTC